MKQAILICAASLLLAGCAGPKPILYPNDHYRQVGADAADSDIKDCMTLAEQAGASPSEGKTAQVATGTVAGGAIGSAAGAVGGAISGTSGDEGPWSARPAARRPGFCAACSGDRRRAGRLPTTWIVVCVSEGMIRQDGSRFTSRVPSLRPFSS
jgi:hypothetical protein